MAFEKSVVIDSKSMAQSEWQQMPEFVQEKQEPFAQIIFRFETEDDLDAFAELIGQKLTGKTKSAWHPHRPHRDPDRRIYK
jgi:hypothetical protein